MVRNMSIKFVVDGVHFEVSTAMEAVEIVRGMKASGVISPTTRQSQLDFAPTDKAELILLEEYDPNALRWTHSMLSVIKTAGPEGLPTDMIMPSLEVESYKAIGGRLGAVNRLLEDIGYPNVYTNNKSANGRVWKPRRNIDVALRRVEQIFQEQTQGAGL